MIDDNRLRHIYAVACRCREIAREMGEPEDFQQQMFLLGWLHDVGYEFSENLSHGYVAYKMLEDSRLLHAGYGYKYKNEIRLHGLPMDATERNHDIFGNPYSKPFKSKALDILNMADLQTAPNGARVTAQERLEIASFDYGRQSLQYTNMYKLCKELELI